MNASTIHNNTFELFNLLNGAEVPATIVYNSATRTATLYPSSTLNSLLYAARVKGGSSGVKDLAGNALASDYIWYFIMIPLFDLTPPTVLSVSPANGATGVNASTDVTAVLSEAMRSSTINTSTVELRNPSNVLVSASVSYNASTRVITLNPSANLAANTVYKAKIKGGSSGVKDDAGNPLSSDYIWSFTTAAPSDNTPPTITSVSPVNGATGISTGTTVSAIFSEAVNTSTISTSTFELRNSANVLVPATVSYNATTRTATLTPSASLSAATLYTVTVKGGAAGVKDIAGNALAANYIWSFTTGASIFDPDILPDYPTYIDQPVEVGMRFRSSVNGQITGLRFYKGAGNTGTHTGHLWTNTGALLGQVTFTQETASGWQQVMFASPISITAGATYVASYYSSAGIYAYTNFFFTQPLVSGALTALADGQDGANGVYKYSSASVFPTKTYNSTNYFVDVIFNVTSGPDVTPPTVTTISPVNNATNVSVNTVVTARFSEPVNASTVNSSTVEVRNSSNTLVAATIAYNASNMTATLTPVSPLSYNTTYNAKIKGGSAGVKDVAGNALVNDYTWTFKTVEAQLPSPNEGPGGPILVISNSSNPFSRYAVEILRAEGLNEFAAADISTVTSSVLNNYDVVVLGEMTVNAAQVLMLTNWVNSGGTLIAFRPSLLLLPLMGILPSTTTLSDKYLLVNTASGPGAGIVNQTMQFHGTADLHLSSGASSIATLYSAVSTSTAYPAVTTMNVGINGGRAVAFTYDLAKSIVYTRQGNPAWAGMKRDGQIDPIRSDDLFFPDWVDFNKIAIPQADEQQRLLANIILQSNLHRKPLPRFWYLPRDLKAAIVMTGDDHSNNGTEGRFNQYKTLGPNTAQDITDWKAIRGTSYMYPNTPISNAQAAAFQAEGFELALHPTTNCLNFTPASLMNDFTAQLVQFGNAYPGLSSPVTNRTHCLAWSDWASEAKTELQKGMRLDATYYYWPQTWMQNRPGMFTGSGMPMRFADLDGSLIDVYQAPTQMTDETNMDYTSFCNTVLDKAIGSEGYYGVFTANMHTDDASSAGSDAIIASALARQIPVISAKQMLTWLDARNNSSFGNMAWSNNQLSFTVTARNDAANLKAMLPFYSESSQLISITRNGTAVPFTQQMIKGMQYAFFAVTPGVSNYVATYGILNTRVANPVSTDSTMEITDPIVLPDQNENIASEAMKLDAKAKAAEYMESLGKLYVSALPNPSTSYFNLVINSNDSKTVTVKVTNMLGQLIEVHEKVNSTSILRLGDGWKGGIYFAEVSQGDKRKVIKIIKAN